MSSALIGFAQSPACFGVQDEQTGSTLCCRMRGIVRPSVELDGWQRVEVKNEAYDAAVAGEIGYLWVAGNADGLYLEDEVWSSEQCAVAAPAPPLEEEVAPQSAAPAPPLEEVASQSSAPAPPLEEVQLVVPAPPLEEVAPQSAAPAPPLPAPPAEQVEAAEQAEEGEDLSRRLSRLQYGWV